MIAMPGTSSIGLGSLPMSDDRPAPLAMPILLPPAGRESDRDDRPPLDAMAPPDGDEIWDGPPIDCLTGPDGDEIWDGPEPLDEVWDGPEPPCGDAAVVRLDAPREIIDAVANISAVLGKIGSLWRRHPLPARAAGFRRADDTEKTCPLRL